MGVHCPERAGRGQLAPGGTRLPARRRPHFGPTVTIDRRQSADTASVLNPPKAIPLHFDAYGVVAAPFADFVRELVRRGVADRIVNSGRGVSLTV